MPLSRELVQSVRRRVAEEPGVLTELLALELKASESEVITSLPLNMRLRARNSAFDVIWNTISKWNNISVKLPNLPEAPSSQDGSGSREARRSVFPFRLVDSLPDRPNWTDQLGFIWFVSKPDIHKNSLSVRFFDKKGEHMLSVYLNPGKNGEYNPVHKADYDAMCERFGVIPVPKNRCKGCRSCTCRETNEAQAGNFSA